MFPYPSRVSPRSPPPSLRQISNDTPRSPRISSLTVPQTLQVGLNPEFWDHRQLRALQLLVQARGAPFDVDCFRLYLRLSTDLFLDPTLFSTVARSCFNPSTLQLSPLGYLMAPHCVPPSASFVPPASTSFLSTWTRLKKVDCSGQGSIILLEGDEKKETVFSRHWRAGGQRKVKTYFENIRRVYWGGPENSERTVEVGVTPYEWSKQYVGGEEMMVLSIIEEVGEGGPDGDDVV